MRVACEQTLKLLTYVECLDSDVLCTLCKITRGDHYLQQTPNEIMVKTTEQFLRLLQRVVCVCRFRHCSR